MLFCLLLCFTRYTITTMKQIKEEVKVIKKFRIAAGLTQTELANKIGTQQFRISLWESGKVKPSINMLIKLSVALGVTVNDLI